jgi:polysaccharide export outer membrane protein
VRPTLYHLALVLTILLFSSCKTQNYFQGTKQAEKIDSSFYAVSSDWQYTIRKNDKISISIWNNDEISIGSIYGIYNSSEGYGKWVMVDGRGNIPIPEMGDLHVEGLTLLSMKDTLVSILAKTIVRPVVDIKVLNREVTILGDVKNAGKIHLEKENNTLIDILGQAGDIEMYGNKSKVQVIRTVNNEVHSISIDLTKTNGFASNNIQIMPGDIVYVPARKSKEWDKRAGSTIIPAASAVTTLILILKTFF